MAAPIKVYYRYHRRRDVHGQLLVPMVLVGNVVHILLSAEVERLRRTTVPACHALPGCQDSGKLMAAEIGGRSGGDLYVGDSEEAGCRIPAQDCVSIAA